MYCLVLVLKRVADQPEYSNHFSVVFLDEPVIKEASKKKEIVEES